MRSRAARLALVPALALAVLPLAGVTTPVEPPRRTVPAGMHRAIPAVYDLEGEARELADAAQKVEAQREEARQRVARRTVAKASRSHARWSGGSGEAIAPRVRHCESGNQNVKNRRSSASGFYQFLDRTWAWVTGLPPPAMAYSFDVQHQAFLTLWADGAGAEHWRESRSCWAR